MPLSAALAHMYWRMYESPSLLQCSTRPLTVQRISSKAQAQHVDPGKLSQQWAWESGPKALMKCWCWGVVQAPDPPKAGNIRQLALLKAAPFENRQDIANGRYDVAPALGYICFFRAPKCMKYTLSWRSLRLLTSALSSTCFAGLFRYALLQ